MNEPFTLYLKMSEAANEVPGGVSPRTVRSWCKKGIRGVKLRHIFVGARCKTTRAWLREFQAKVAPQPVFTKQA